MNSSSRWITRLFLLSPALFSIACCHSHPQADALSRQAVRHGSQQAADANAASAIHELNQPASAAENTLQSINVARNVVLDNLSNAQTAGFKCSRILFLEDGQFRLQHDFSQGQPESTNRALDLAIQGDGFFHVRISDDMGDGTAYAHNGNLFVNKTGALIVGIGDGYKLLPPVTIPLGTTDDEINITQEGLISVEKPGTIQKTVVGQIKLSLFTNPQGLKSLGNGLYQATDDSGPPIETLPGEKGAGLILQNFLESSNVNIDHERARLHMLNQWREILLEAIGLPPDARE